MIGCRLMPLSSAFRSLCTLESNMAVTIVYAVVISIIISACGNSDEKKTDLLANGQTYFHKGDYFMARLQFKQALQIDPDLTDAYYNLGITEVHLGNVKQALSDFMRVLTLNPNHADTNIQVGRIMLDAGFPEKAIQRANLVLSADETNRTALMLKATALLKLDNPQDKAKTAEQFFEELLSAGDLSAEIYYHSAHALLLQNNLKKAQVRIAEGLAQHPDNALLYELLADIYQQQGETENAARTYRRLITLSPSNPDYIFELAQLLWEADQKDAARKILAQRMLTAGAPDVSVWLRLSRFYTGRNANELAENTLVAGLQTHPQSFELRLALARMLIDRADYVSAIKRLYPALANLQDKPGTDIDDAQLLLSKSFLAIGEFDVAEQYVARYLEDSPQSQEGHYIKGIIRLLGNDPHGATSEFWSILATNPSNAAAKIQLAHAMTRMDQWKEAIEVLSSGIKKNRNEAVLRYGLFQIYLFMHNHIQAEAQLEEILAKNPDDIQAMTMLAEFYRSIDALDKAKESYRAILQISPRKPAVYIRLSEIYAAEKNPNRAIKQLLEGLAALPDSDDILTALVETYIKQGRKSSAVRTAKNKLKTDPQDPLGYLLLGKVYTALWEYGKSEKAYLDAINLAPDSTAANEQLMEFWYLRKKKKRITDYYRSLITARPDTPAPSIALAKFYIKEKKYSEAIELYESILSKQPENLRYAIDLIRLMCENPRSRKDLDYALNSAKKILKNHPDNPEVLATLGWAYYHNGDLNHALGYLYRAIDLGPNQSIALYYLAKLSLYTDHINTARAALEMILTINEDFPEKKEVEKMLKDLQTRYSF